MKIHFTLCILLLVSLNSCDPEPDGPEKDCHILQNYKLDYHGINAPKVFDIRTDPPLEIRNGTIEYDLFYQWINLHDNKPVPYPYSEYFIDSVSFMSQTTAEVGIFEINTSRLYEYVRSDCQIEMESTDGNLHFELMESGDEISETRFAIYDHKSRRVMIDTLSFIDDTFLFIEFRLGPFASYEEIIRQFAFDYPGQYDTIAIEQVENKTKE